VGKSNTNHKLIASDGQYIVLPPGMSGQYIENLKIPTTVAADTVQQYPLGTRFVSGDRVYRYAKANGTCYPQFGAFKNKKSNTVAVAPTQKTAAEQALAYPGETLASGAAGSYYVAVTIDTEIGVLTTGVLTANELAGGYIVIGNGSAQSPQFRLIVSHPALATTGGTLVVKVDMPLTAACTAAVTTLELIESPFYNVAADGAGGGEYVSFIGVPACTASSGQYVWIQTYGPVWLTSNSNTCDSAMDRTIVFVGNGSVVSSNDVTVESGFQIAGYALDASGSGASNAPFVFLTLMA
jgi:hypothetical protein